MTDLLLKKGFNYFQIEEIQDAIRKNLKIDFLLNTKFSTNQMQEIKLGLNKGIDVSLYAKPEFGSTQMEQIRLGLLEGLDVSVYTNPEYTHSEMRSIREAIKLNLDVRKFINKTNISNLPILAKLKRLGYNIIDLLSKSFNTLISILNKKSEDILNNKINRAGYKIKQFSQEQLDTLKEFLENGYDITASINPNYKINKIKGIAISLKRLEEM